MISHYKHFNNHSEQGIYLMSRSSLHGTCTFKVWYMGDLCTVAKLSGAETGNLKLREHIIIHKGMSRYNNILQ